MNRYDFGFYGGVFALVLGFLLITLAPIYMLYFDNRIPQKMNKSRILIIEALRANPNNELFQKQALDFNLELERSRGTVAFDTINAIDFSQFKEKK